MSHHRIEVNFPLKFDQREVIGRGWCLLVFRMAYYLFGVSREGLGLLFIVDVMFSQHNLRREM